MDGRVNERKDRRSDGCTDGWFYGQMCARVNESMEWLLGRLMYIWAKGWWADMIR